MESTKTRTFDLINQELSKKLEDKKERVREEARREIILCSKSNHKSGVFVRNSKFSGLVSVVVARGQFFTTYKELVRIWGCTKDQARYQLKKWQKSGKIKVQTIKDQKGFDFGLLITYNWLVNQQSEVKQKRKLKIPIREQRQKAHQKEEEKNFNSEIPTHKKEMLSKDNIHKKDDVFFGKAEEEKRKINEIEKELNEMKLNPKVRDRILKDYDLNLILDYLKLLNLCGENVKNRAGWIVEALKQNYDLQKVENWRQEEEAEREAEQKRQEAERQEKARLEEAEERRRAENLIIESWIRENGEEVENRLYFEVFEGLKKSNLIIYNYLNKKKAGGLNILDMLKKDPFVRGEVRRRILEKSSKNCLCLA